mgnify:CR=1 FL=1
MRAILNKSIELARAMYPANISTDERRCFHFSFIWDKSKLLVAAQNKQGTHPRNRFNLKEFDISLKNQCSEMRAFIIAKSRFEKLNWKKVKMVNVRLNRRGEIKNSRCCPACSNLINYLGIKNLYFTDDNGEFQKY